VILCYNNTKLNHAKEKGATAKAGISFSCMVQRANISAQQKMKLCKSGFASLNSLKLKEKGATAEAGISFSCMVQRANISAQQKIKLCKSGFASLNLNPDWRLILC
jgi:predicted small secreted protein